MRVLHAASGLRAGLERLATAASRIQSTSTAAVRRAGAGLDRLVETRLLRGVNAEEIAISLVVYLGSLWILARLVPDHGAVLAFAVLVGFAVLVLRLRGWAFPALGLAWVLQRYRLPTHVGAPWTLATTVLVGLMLAVAVHKLRATQRLKRDIAVQHESLRSLMDQMPLAVLVTDRERRVTRTSAGLERLVGTRARGPGDTCRDRVGCTNPVQGPCDDACGLMRAVAGGPVSGGRRIVLRDAEDRPQQVEAMVSPLRGADGAIRGGVLVLKDIRTELELERIRTAYLERIQQQMSLARTIQERLLEPRSMTIHLGRRGLEVEVRAFNAPSMELGGDFYRFFQTGDERACVVLGDVQGKGLAAALIMSMAMSLFEEALRQERQPGAILAHVNRRLSDSLPSSTTFVTAIALVVDAAEGTYSMARAGHEPALLLRRRHCREVPRAGGMPLGLEPDATYPEERIPLRRDDVFLLYTDGLVEIGALAAPLLSSRTLRRLAEHASPGRAAELHARLSAALAGDHLPARDDVTFVTVGVTWEDPCQP